MSATARSCHLYFGVAALNNVISAGTGHDGESNHGQNREPHSTVRAERTAGHDVARLGKLPIARI
jgi:hypothetical protein